MFRNLSPRQKKMQKKFNKIVRWGKFVCLAFLLLAAFAVAVAPRVTGWRWLWVHGPSVNISVGLLRPGIPEKIKAGDYVLITWKGVDPNGISKLWEGAALVKKVACLPGQHLKVTLRQADCDGIKVGHIRHETIDGRPIAPALYDGIIPPGKVFLQGEHYYSYDSRYFGLVPYAWIQGTLVLHK